MKEFFSESGSASMTRLTTFMLVCASVVIAGCIVWFVYKSKPVGDLLTLVTTLLSFGLGAKVIQKFAETKTDAKEEAK
ncbi:MAG: hypothetical protein K1X86_15435 [Ignavibacteria bacterium]|nr:hypothetical protein [Ignavibacteria bacterium]